MEEPRKQAACTKPNAGDHEKRVQRGKLGEAQSSLGLGTGAMKNILELVNGNDCTIPEAY